MDAMLVAVRPWDIDGASRAGLATAWINRAASTYPQYFQAPDLRPVSLTDLADQLGWPDISTRRPHRAPVPGTRVQLDRAVAHDVE
jgi:hypothetical protein